MYCCCNDQKTMIYIKVRSYLRSWFVPSWNWNTLVLKSSFILECSVLPFLRLVDVELFIFLQSGVFLLQRLDFEFRVIEAELLQYSASGRPDRRVRRGGGSHHRSVGGRRRWGCLGSFSWLEGRSLGSKTITGGVHGSLWLDPPDFLSQPNIVTLLVVQISLKYTQNWFRETFNKIFHRGGGTPHLFVLKSLLSHFRSF